MRKMTLERLPNEIFLELFVYFNGVDLLCLFYGLNARFNILLYEQFRFYRLNFYQLSKRHFDLLRQQQHLLHMSHQVVALSFPNAHLAPDGLHLFFSFTPSLERFIRLQSLSVSQLHSKETTMQVIANIPYLINLVHFRLQALSVPNDDQIDYKLLVAHLWNLPKLTDCDLTSFIREPTRLFPMSAILSSSLQCLSIDGWSFRTSTIDQLFRYTPHLKSVQVLVDASDMDAGLSPSALPTLIKLTMAGYGIPDFGRSSFWRKTPNLRHLDITLHSPLIDGHQWQRIIRQHLPHLQTFHFNITSYLGIDELTEERIDQLIDSFRGSFWTVEHQWFVRCLVQDSLIYLYTLSNSSCHSHLSLPQFFKSTCPEDNLTKFYEHATFIDALTFFDHPIPVDVRLPHLRNLSVKFPIHEQLWRVVTEFNQLHKLSVHSYTDRFSSQFQTILDRAPLLEQLSIKQDQSQPVEMSIFQHANTSIRYLYLDEHYFSDEECLTLSRSPLGVQCERLQLCVQTRENILTLTTNMPSLHLLDVQCQHSDENIQQWLTNYLPSSCSIVVNSRYRDRVRIWFSL